MFKIIKDFIDINDSKNSYSSSKDFEDNLKMKLKQKNIIEIQMKNGSVNEKKLYKSKLTKLKNYIEELKLKEINTNQIENNFKEYFLNDTFIYQPFGSQKFPDFIIFYKNNIILFEFKWSKNNNIVFNDSLPFYHAFYFFATPNNLFLFQGKNLIDFNTYLKLNNDVKILRNNNKKNCEEWTIYWRPQFQLKTLNERFWTTNKNKFKKEFIEDLEKILN